MTNKALRFLLYTILFEAGAKGLFFLLSLRLNIERGAKIVSQHADTCV